MENGSGKIPENERSSGLGEGGKNATQGRAGNKRELTEEILSNGGKAR